MVVHYCDIIGNRGQLLSMVKGLKMTEQEQYEYDRLFKETTTGKLIELSNAIHDFFKLVRVEFEKKIRRLSK